LRASQSAQRRPGRKVAAILQAFRLEFPFSLILIKDKICKGIDRPADQSWSDQYKQDAAYRDYIVF
jgi:hypothetical protein